MYSIVERSVLQRAFSISISGNFQWGQPYREIRGDFHSTNISKYLKRGQMVWKFPGKEKEIRKLLSFRKVGHSLNRNFGSSARYENQKEKHFQKIPKLWVCLNGLSQFFERLFFWLRSQRTRHPTPRWLLRIFENGSFFWLRNVWRFMTDAEPLYCSSNPFVLQWFRCRGCASYEVPAVVLWC